MSDPSTHYENLQVIESASPEVIRAAYRCLCQKLHPDRNPPALREQCERVMQIVNEAYEILADAESREAYDRSLAQQRQGSDAGRARQTHAYFDTDALEQESVPEFDEHAAYELIDKELEGHQVDRGFWLKAFVLSNGDATRQKLHYIQLRLDYLRTTEKAKMDLDLAEKRSREHARQADQAKALKAVFAAGSRLDRGEIEKLARAAAADRSLLKAVDRVRGNTLLHVAAEADLRSAVEFLLNLGARPDAVNQSGRKPHELCSDAILARLLKSMVTA